MKRVLSAVLLSFFIASCAMPPQRQDTQYLVGRALEAMGPAGAVASLQTMSLTGTARFWEPSSHVSRAARCVSRTSRPSS
jgi:hypothetical protein